VHWLVARRLVYLWASAYYIGQMSKDVLRLPRPPPAVTIDCTGPSTVLRAWRTPTPKPYGRIDPRLGPNGIVRLERHYETEGGMPSTHSMNAVSMPWLIVSLLVSLSPPSPDASPSAPLSAFHTGLYVIGVLWTVLCISSRLYMGVHSPADMVVGAGLGNVLAHHLDAVVGAKHKIYVAYDNPVTAFSSERGLYETGSYPHYYPASPSSILQRPRGRPSARTTPDRTTSVSKGSILRTTRLS
jgi:membrane-associated phospholipid phosphatase